MHALCGGGPATDGLYFAGITWCGVEKHSKVYLAPTDRPVTCKRCKAALAKRGASCYAERKEIENSS